MIDVHCHILPGLDDGARDEAEALALARALVAEGVESVVCTPHIQPGVYANTGPEIRRATRELQLRLDARAIPLHLLAGADNHVVPNFVCGLQSGTLLSLADSRYVLVEPPHDVCPPRLAELLFEVSTAGYVPVLTHPERLTWIGDHYGLMVRLVRRGVWMQVTAGSLAGHFSQTARYWSERMLNEGLAHILATDAHDTRRRCPLLSLGRKLAARIVGEDEALHLVDTRPRGVISNTNSFDLPIPAAQRQQLNR